MTDTPDTADDKTMLSPAQRKGIVEWLDKHGAVKPCTACGQTAWHLIPHLVAPPTFRKESGFFLGGMSYPQAMLLCKNCGHTLYFNAVVMGIVPMGEPPKPSDPPKETPDGGRG